MEVSLIEKLVLRHQRIKHAREVADRRSQAELDGQWAMMREYGICTGCYGRCLRDDPPWGIVVCTECGGTGRAK
jgi:hypothetical protein